MGSQGDSGSNGKQLQFQQLTRQNSMYSLTLDEVQTQMGDVGKPLSSMNLDELLKNVWTLEANQTFDLGVAPQFAQQGQWMPYPQPLYHHPDRSIMGVYMLPQRLMDVSYPENQLQLHSPLMGTLSDTQASGRKRGASEEMVEKNVEMRQKRMIRNRESAARSRARKLVSFYLFSSLRM
ncbi:ABSCISIC ACID-INSENSITIVE 5-like protein 2 [Hibiscus syriacus]|uniref:ABSCISIC ACID-INSENSITIVE 5-like protein 2 n=1 Tax=Hibiscus syriacus TaxID=106335 RepID=A0A6A3BGH5_HIBSY|nr:ABSCISIC ACID-INSENSITIVE 5-like protein 2 [Hibiscus syriacus]